MNAILLIIISAIVGVVGWVVMAFIAARRTVKAITQSLPEEKKITQDLEQRKQQIDDQTAQRIRDAYSAPRDNVIQLFRDRMFPKGPNKPSA